MRDGAETSPNVPKRPTALDGLIARDVTGDPPSGTTPAAVLRERSRGHPSTLWRTVYFY